MAHARHRSAHPAASRLDGLRQDASLICRKEQNR
jgi:hypothetical protein